VTCSRLPSVGSAAYHVPAKGPAGLVVVVPGVAVGGIVFLAFVFARRPEPQEKPYFAYWV